jgi:hypothetical protein
MLKKQVPRLHLAEDLGAGSESYIVLQREIICKETKTMANTGKKKQSEWSLRIVKVKKKVQLSL